MFLRRLKERPLRMAWRVEKGPARSFLVGTAHFSPYSFRGSLVRLLRDSRVALFEGPLDAKSMDQVVQAGTQVADEDRLLSELDRSTLDAIARALDLERARSSVGLHLVVVQTGHPVSELTKSMKPWMAFFTLYSQFLERRGWRHSVDLEAYNLARSLGVQVVPLETIEEQIKVLETLSREDIVDFLRRVDRWSSYTRDFMKWYLSGDLDKIARNPYRFPTRNPQVIEHRDRTLYERMRAYLEEGNAAAFVGSPHVTGIRKMLIEDGFQVIQGQP
ncbi:MAG: TraB/GumN family protein [Desulfomonile sp.]|nr:TraB/GumN family protein [Desulfomonile sp.]